MSRLTALADAFQPPDQNPERASVALATEASLSAVAELRGALLGLVPLEAGLESVLLLLARRIDELEERLA